MNQAKFDKVLGVGMGAVMSGVLNFSAMVLLGAPLTVRSVMFGWAGAFAIALAIGYLFPVMDWCLAITKNIQNKTAEYIVRILIFAFIQVLFNSVWCLVNTGLIEQWPKVFLPLLAIATIAIFIALPIVGKIAAAMAKE